MELNGEVAEVKTNNSTLDMIVERLERIHASVLGAAVLSFNSSFGRSCFSRAPSSRASGAVWEPPRRSGNAGLAD